MEGTVLRVAKAVGGALSAVLVFFAWPVVHAAADGPTKIIAQTYTAESDSSCGGDCNRDRVVSAGDLTRMIFLVQCCDGNSLGCPEIPIGCPMVPIADRQCANADSDGSGTITAAEFDAAIQNIFVRGSGCLDANATTYPILDPRYAYAADRHGGETRVGSLGTIKSGDSSLAETTPCPINEPATPCSLRFNYEFRDQGVNNENVGVFFSLGRIGIETTKPDGTPGDDLNLHRDSAFDLTNPLHNTQDARVSIDSLRLRLRSNAGDQTLTLRIELEDENGAIASRTLSIHLNAIEPTTLVLPLGNFDGITKISVGAVKLVKLVIYEQQNPPSGGFDIDVVAFVDDDGPRLEAHHLLGLDETDILGELARRDFESLLRLVDAKTGATIDRTLFRDLIHWGATGWLLAALPFAVEKGWIDEDDARGRALRVLRFVDDDSLWGDEPAGKLGNSRGIMYRFGGIDPTGLFGPLTGTRKIDRAGGPIPDGPNSTEASVIDTALFQFGALTCAAGFSGDMEIGNRVRSILGRTRWDELLFDGRIQLAWKPLLDDTVHGGCFTAPAAFGGFWASAELNGDCALPETATPITIDYWTDEGGLAAILAAGSESHSTGAAPWYNMERQERQLHEPCEGSVVVTYPGAWFTYAFLTAIYLDPTLGSDRGDAWGTIAVDWVTNARRVFRAYECLGPMDELVLPDAVEHPDASYSAQADPTLAVDPQATFKGTRTPWSLQLATGLGPEEAASARAELRKLLQGHPEHWDPALGILDSFHPDVATFPDQEALRRKQGRWAQQQVFSLNKGAALLAQLNAVMDGAVWRAANRHPAVERGIEVIYGIGDSTPTPSTTAGLPSATSAPTATGGPLVSPTGTSTGTATTTSTATRSQTSTRTNAATPTATSTPTPQVAILLEGEHGSGDGAVMPRSAASGQQTVALQANQAREFSFMVGTGGSYAISVRYSNDNFGPFETVDVTIDDVSVGQFVAQDTGDFGNGWNVFATSGSIATVNLSSGLRELVVSVQGGDCCGIEIDVITLTRVDTASGAEIPRS